METEAKPVFRNVDPKWCGGSELLLLEAIMDKGYGNWDYIAEELSNESGKQFSAEEVRDHYDKIYIHGNMGLATWEHVRSKSQQKLFDHTSPEEDAVLLNPDLTGAKNIPMSVQKNLGYMPLRADFEMEYDFEAESVLREVYFDSSDDEVETELNLTCIDIYRRRVKDRYHRKEMINSHKLIEKFSEKSEIMKILGNKRKCDRDSDDDDDYGDDDDDDEEMQALVDLARFMPLEELEEFYKDCVQEKKLKAQIAELISLRERGITDIDIDEDISGGERKMKLRKRDISVPEPSSNQPEKLLDLGNEDISENEGVYGSDSDAVNPISSLKGYELLSRREKKLCEVMGLRPIYYISYKAALICADVEKQKGNSIDSFNLYPAGLDKKQCQQIMNFMIESGWIKSDSLL